MITDKKFIAKVIENTENISASKLSMLLEKQYKGSKSDLEKFLNLSGTYDVLEAVNKLNLVDFYFTTEEEREQIRKGNKQPLGTSQSGHKLIRGLYKYSLEDKLESETLNYGFDMISHLMIFASEKNKEEFKSASGESLRQHEKIKSNIVKKRINDFTSNLETLIEDESELRKVPSISIRNNIRLLKTLNKQTIEELDKAVSRLHGLRELHPELYEKSLEDFTTPVTGGTILGWFKKDEIKDNIPKYINKYVKILSHPKKKDKYTIQEINNFYGRLFDYYSLHNKVSTVAHLSKKLDDIETIKDNPEKIKQYGKQENYEKAIRDMRKTIDETDGMTVFKIADLIDIYPATTLREQENYDLTQEKTILNQKSEQEFRNAVESFKYLFYQDENTIKKNCSKSSIPKTITKHYFSAILNRDDWQLIKKYFQLKSASRKEADIITGTSINEFKEMYKNIILSSRKTAFVNDYATENKIELANGKNEIKKSLKKVKKDDLAIAEDFNKTSDLTLKEILNRLNIIHPFSREWLDNKTLFNQLSENNIYSKSLMGKIKKGITEVKKYQKLDEQSDNQLYNKIATIFDEWGSVINNLDSLVPRSTLKAARAGYINPKKIEEINKKYNTIIEVKNEFYDLFDIKEQGINSLEILNSDKEIDLVYNNMPDKDSKLIKNKTFKNKMDKTWTRYDPKEGKWVSNHRTSINILEIIKRVQQFNRNYNTNIEISTQNA